MSLITAIEDEIKEAMKARDAERRDALRLIVNALKGSEKELQRPLSDDEELQVLQRAQYVPLFRRYFDQRFDDVFTPVTPACRHIPWQREILQAR